MIVDAPLQYLSACTMYHSVSSCTYFLAKHKAGGVNRSWKHLQHIDFLEPSAVLQ